MPRSDARSVAVLGPGGVGGLVAAALHRAGTPVTVVAREQTAERIARDGLCLRSVRLGEHLARPRAVARLDVDVDVLVVATKAPALEAALGRVGGAPGLVVPLLNGVEHMAVLRAAWPGRVCAASIRVNAERLAPGVVEHTSPFLRIDLARLEGREDDVEAAAHLLRAAEIPTTAGAAEPDVLWGKLVRLAALSLTTAAFDAPLGAIRAHPRHRQALEGAVREAGAVARAEGAAILDRSVLAEIAEAHDGLTTSMRRDVREGRAGELDAIAGAVRRAAARHGLECPTIDALAARVAERLP
jgi:2-dehydropantoate 2-reductase